MLASIAKWIKNRPIDELMTDYSEQHGHEKVRDMLKLTAIETDAEFIEVPKEHRIIAEQLWEMNQPMHEGKMSWDRIGTEYDGYIFGKYVRFV